MLISNLFFKILVYSIVNIMPFIVLDSVDSDKFKKAELAFEKKNYTEAKDLYKEALTIEKDSVQFKLIQYKIGLCHIYLKEHEEFYSFLNNFREKNIGNIWEAKSYYLDGLSQSYKYSYSRSSGAESFSKARELFNKFIGTKDFPVRDLIEIDILLADKLEFNLNQYYRWDEGDYNPNDEIKSLDELEKKSLLREEGEYSSDWENRKKNIYLYREILELAKKDEKKYYFTLYDFGNYLRRVARTDIYRNESIKMLKEVISQSSVLDMKAKAQYILALVNENSGEYISAIDEFQKIVDMYSSSKWVNDAKSHIQEIRRPYLNMTLKNQFMIDDTLSFEISSKNVQKVTCTIYQINLPILLERKWKSKKTNLNSFESLFEDSKSVIKSAEKIITEWEIKIEDKKDYKYVSTPVSIPDKILRGKIGQYVIVIKNENLYASGFINITDLIMVQRAESGNVHSFIVDASTGKPVSDVNLFYRYGSYNDEAKFTSGKTDDNGRYSENIKGSNYPSFSSFGFKDRSFVATNNFYLNYSSRNEKSYSKYTITDRPVYRPNQTIYFKHIIKLNENGKYSPVSGEEIVVTIRDAKYQEVSKQTLKTNQFGSVYGEYKIPDGAPLGVYNFLLRIKDVDQYDDYVQSFRVEEYKRPEVKVNIEPISEKLKIGNNLKIKIHSEYYFGGPVPDAEVQYIVKRTRSRQSFYSSNEYDWLYGRGFSEDKRWNYNWWYYDSREVLVDNKTIKSNQDGDVILNYETESLLKEDWNDDYKYTIYAKVTDASRRVIEESKSIVVSKREFNVFVKNERGFLSVGEKTKFNIFALTSNYLPKDASGKVLIYKLTSLKEKVKNEIEYDEEKIQEEKVSLVNGKANYIWQTKSAGRYKIVFETTDSDSEIVKNELLFWVIDNTFSGKSFYFKKIEIISEKEIFKEGEMVNLMINVDKPGSFVWVSFEGDNFIIKQEVVFIEGKSKLFSFKINKQFVPNFFINAFVVSGGECYTDSKQIYVPPESQLLNVEIKTDKETYKPGEKAKFFISTKNNKGEPVQSEVSLSVVDASIFYIQNILIPDIRKFYFGYLRNNNIMTINSLSYSINTHFDDYNKYFTFELHGFPDGWYRMSRLLRYFVELSGDNDDGNLGVSPSMDRKSEGKDVASESAPEMDKEVKRKKNGGSNGESEKSVEGDGDKVKIRENFNETVYWNPIIQTDKNGKAEIDFNFNDALTQWHISAKSITTSSEVGESEHEVKTKKDLLVRLQAPRFFLEKDEILISANVHNYSLNEKSIEVSLDIFGGTLELFEKQKKQYVKVNFNGEQRVDWRVKVIKPGNVTLVVKAVSSDDNDAVKMEFPVLEYGIEKFIAFNRELKQKNEDLFEIDIPNEIRPNSQSLEISISPSLATIALSALPYLINYPYGCFEQTINRFVPAVIVAKTISDLGIELSDIAEYNQKLNPKLLPYWSPVYNKEELNKAIVEGLKRIYNFQNSNGGFSWWPGFSSDAYMTSVGIISLINAKKSGIDVRMDVLEKAVSYLTHYLKTNEGLNDNTKAYMYYAVSCYKPENLDLKGLNELFKIRDHLTLYSFSLLGLTYENLILKDLGKFQLVSLDYPLQNDKTLMNLNLSSTSYNNMVILRDNLLDRVRVDKENNTAFWNPESSYYWLWYNDRLETTIMILKFLNHVDSKNEILGKIVRWLVNNRKGNAWHSTKDTGLAIEVLMEYIRINRELDVDYSVQILIDDKKFKEFKVNKENIFTFDNRISLSSNNISSGKHSIRIIKDGKGNLYSSTFVKFFTREDSIKAAGNEMSISRSYFRLIREENLINNEKRIDYREIPLKYGETLKSGDELRVKLTIDSKNDYEYLIFEDMKPSGCEFKLLKSWGGYMELRDTKVVFFESWLRQGKNYVQYDLRAEIPGIFHVMPSNGYAMYSPEIRGISDAFKMSIIDK